MRDAPPPFGRTVFPWFAWLVLVALAACSSPVSSEPPVADSTLVDVLVDLHMLDARDELQGDVPPVLLDSVLTRHGLDTTRFNAALTYYSHRPQAYTVLYDEVIDRLNEFWESSLYEREERVLPDSAR